MRFLTTDNKIQNKYYYNNATLVKGEDKFNYFEKKILLKILQLEV